MYGRPLGFLLSKFDIYISGSRSDPGPNHVIESISCGLPTFVHYDGGGSVEFAGESFTYKSIDDLLKSFDSKSIEKMNSNTFETWGSCIERYFDVIKIS